MDAEGQKKIDDFIKEMQNPEEALPFDPCLQIPCFRCGGDLMYTGPNLLHTLAFLQCQGKCCYAYVVKMKPDSFSSESK